MTFQLPIRVYIEDTDAGGIVYYVNYLKFMERARTEFMRHLGFGKTALFSEAKMFVVFSADTRFTGTAKLDDDLRVTAVPTKVSRSNILFDQRVLRGEDTLCRSDIRIACVCRSSGKPCAMPDEMYAAAKACEVRPT